MADLEAANCHTNKPVTAAATDRGLAVDGTVHGTVPAAVAVVAVTATVNTKAPVAVDVHIPVPAAVADHRSLTVRVAAADCGLAVPAAVASAYHILLLRAVVQKSHILAAAD